VPSESKMRMLVPLEVAREKSTGADWRSRTDIPSAQRVKELVIRHRYIALWSHRTDSGGGDQCRQCAHLRSRVNRRRSRTHRITARGAALGRVESHCPEDPRRPVCVLHPHSQSVCVLRGTSGGHNYKHSLGRVYCIPSSLDAHHL